MSEVPEGMVKVRVNQNHKDKDTQLVYYNGDEPVITGDEAGRMVSEGYAEILEEGSSDSAAQEEQTQAEAEQA